MIPFCLKACRRGTSQTLAGVSMDLIPLYRWLCTVDCVAEKRLSSVAIPVLLDSNSGTALLLTLKNVLFHELLLISFMSCPLHRRPGLPTRSTCKATAPAFARMNASDPLWSIRQIVHTRRCIIRQNVTGSALSKVTTISRRKIRRVSCHR